MHMRSRSRLQRFRIKRDHGGDSPKGGFPFIAELPVAIRETGDAPRVKLARMLRAPLKDWLASVINRRFRWYTAFGSSRVLRHRT